MYSAGNEWLCIVLVYSGPFAIVLTYAPSVKSTKTVDTAKDALLLLFLSATDFKAAKLVFITRNTEVIVPVGALQAGLHYFSLHPIALTNRLALHASGMVRTVRYRSFRILIAKISTKLTSFPPHMLVTVADHLPEMVAQFHSDELSPRKEREEKSVGLPYEKMGELMKIYPRENAEKKRSMFRPYQKVEKYLKPRLMKYQQPTVKMGNRGTPNRSLPEHQNRRARSPPDRVQRSIESGWFVYRIRKRHH